ncbi:MAG TPA: septum formation family protein, partial [Micromonosporaceae bacterium]
IAAVIAAASVLALAACSTLPKGVDGDLVDNWATMATPTQVLPKVGDCYSLEVGNMQANNVEPCSSSHLVEIFFVGVFTDAAAAAKTPPKDGLTALAGAYGICQAPAKKFLGEDWHDGLLTVGVIAPDADGWTGGARWFACSVSVAEGLDNSDATYSAGSLKGVLTKPGKLKLSCVNWTNGKASFSNEKVGSCAKPHSAEFAGLYRVPGAAYPSTKRYEQVGGAGCQTVVAHYLGFSDGVDRNSTVGWAWAYNTKAEWNDGDHTLRCYASAYTHDRKFTGTVKGIGRRNAKG